MAGNNLALASEVSQPELKVKRKWFKKLGDQHKTLTAAEIKTIVRNMFPAHQDHLKDQFESDFYTKILKNIKSDDRFLRRFSRLVPTTCKTVRGKRVHSFLRSHPDLPMSVTKKLRISAQENERCVKARAVSLNAL